MPNQLSLDLTLPEGVRFFTRRLQLPPGLSYEQWLDIGRYLSKARGALAFWLADWRETGRRELGDEQVAAGIAQLHFEGEDWRAVEALNRVHERVEGLTAEHHFILAKASDAATQKMWTETAVEKDLTPRELQLSMRQGSVVRITNEQSGHTSAGLATIEAVNSTAKRYLAQVGEQWKQWTREDCERVLEELRPLEEFIGHLQVRLMTDLAPQGRRQQGRTNDEALRRGEETL